MFYIKWKSVRLQLFTSMFIFAQRGAISNTCFQKTAFRQVFQELDNFSIFKQKNTYFHINSNTVSIL